MCSHAFCSSGVRWFSIFITLPTISSRIRRTRAEPFGVMQTITLRRSSRAAERIRYRRFVEHLVLRQPPLRFDEVVKATVVDQLHHHVELAVVHPQREDLHDVGMIYRGSNARLLLQLSVMICFATKILVQQFERNEPLQLGVSSLVHGPHSTGTKRFHRYKMIECPLEQVFLAAVSADYAHQGFITAGLEHRSAYPTRWRHEQPPSSIDMEIDCNIDEFEGKRMPWRR